MTMTFKQNNKTKSPLYYYKTFEELQTLIEEIGGTGEWKKCSDTHYQFTNVYGARFNWWSTTGAVRINGNKRSAAILRFKFLPKVSEKYQKLLCPEPNATVPA